MNVLQAGSEGRRAREPGGYLSANRQRGLSGGNQCLGDAVVLLLQVG